MSKTGKAKEDVVPGGASSALVAPGAKTGPRAAARALFAVASQLHVAGKLPEAVSGYERALSASDMQPVHFQAAGNMATALLDMNRPVEALAACDRSLTLLEGIDRTQQAQAWFNRGNCLAVLGRHKEAALSFHKGVKLNPKDTDGLFNLGNSLDHLGRWGDAIKTFDAVLKLDATHASAMSNRGVALFRLGRMEEAIAGFDIALSISPDIDNHGNRGDVLRELGRLEDALAEYDKSIAMNTKDSRNESADQISSNGVESLYKKARLLTSRGGHAVARETFQRLLAVVPGHARAAHMLAALEGPVGPSVFPGAPSDASGFPAALHDFVKEEFDQFASTFESALVGQLQYQTPKLLSEVLQRAVILPVGYAHGRDKVEHREQGTVLSLAAADCKEGGVDVEHCPGSGLSKGPSLGMDGRWGMALDLGCGTGLFAPFLRPLVDRLVGVDISPLMVEKAAARSDVRYDELIVGEVVSVLEDRFDDCSLALVSAADVFVYFASLADVFRRTYQVLECGGVFVFSTEKLGGGTDDAEGGIGRLTAANQSSQESDLENSPNWVLQHSGRYAHARFYVEALAQVHGFKVIQHQAGVGRLEAGRPVTMDLFVLQKSA